MDAAVITFRFHNGGLEADLSLPVDIPLQNLIPQIRACLHAAGLRILPDPSSWTCNGKSLNLEKALDEMEIWDGAVIMM